MNYLTVIKPWLARKYRGGRAQEGYASYFFFDDGQEEAALLCYKQLLTWCAPPQPLVSVWERPKGRAWRGVRSISEDPLPARGVW